MNSNEGPIDKNKWRINVLFHHVSNPIFIKRSVYKDNQI